MNMFNFIETIFLIKRTNTSAAYNKLHTSSAIYICYNYKDSKNVEKTIKK